MALGIEHVSMQREKLDTPRKLKNCKHRSLCVVAIACRWFSAAICNVTFMRCLHKVVPVLCSLYIIQQLRNISGNCFFPKLNIIINYVAKEWGKMRGPCVRDASIGRFVGRKKKKNFMPYINYSHSIAVNGCSNCVISSGKSRWIRMEGKSFGFGDASFFFLFWLLLRMLPLKYVYLTEVRDV